MTNLPTPVAPAAPGGFAPISAMGFVGSDGQCLLASIEDPLPIRVTPIAAATPLTATLSATGSSSAFTPSFCRPIWLTLSGVWAGTVTVLRSTDGGTTKLPMTIGGQPFANFTGNAQEQLGEESEAGATWYVQFTRSSGSVTVRVAQ